MKVFRDRKEQKLGIDYTHDPRKGKITFKKPFIMKPIELIKIEETRLKESVMNAIKQFEENTELGVAYIGLIIHSEETQYGALVRREIGLTYNTMKT